MRSGPLKKHVYDVDAMELFFQAKNYFEEQKSFSDWKEWLAELSTDIKNHCIQKGLDYDYFFRLKNMVVVDSTSNYFSWFLSLALALIEPAKIKLFLAYQKAQFKPGNDKFQSFIDLLEFGIIINEVKRSPFDNQSIRLEEITKWIETERQKDVFIKDKRKYLEWTRDQSLLPKLSRELKTRYFTAKPTDFEKVFTERKKIQWLKEPVFLAFLLRMLYKDYSAFKVLPGGKGYLMVSSEYFSDYSEKSEKKFDFSNLLYYYDQTKGKNPDNTQERVINLLSQIFK